MFDSSGGNSLVPRVDSKLADRQMFKMLSINEKEKSTMILFLQYLKTT